MKLINALAASVLLLLSPIGLYAQAYMQAPAQNQIEKEDQVKTAEVFRRGDHVEHIGVTRSSEEDMYLAAVSTPADDSNKWFITIYSMPNCKYCDQLIRDFQTQKPLTAFANPSDHKASWAHFNVYSNDDGLQAWRFKALKITAFPTIVITPPLNGRFGNPSTVVMQKSGYKSTADSAAILQKQMSEKIKAYVKTVKPNQSPTLAPSPDQRVVAVPQSVLKTYQAKPTASTGYPRQFSNEQAGGIKGLWGEDPRGGILTPFKPKPKVDPPLVTPPNTPPDSTPDLVIPDGVDPDVKPVTPGPVDPNAPPTGPPSAKPDTKTITVVYESAKYSAMMSDTGFLKRLAEAQQKYPDHKLKHLEYEDAVQQFKKLSKIQTPAILVTDADGNTVEATTQPTPNPFPWQAALAAFVSGFTDPTSLTILGAWALTALRNWRKNRNKKILIPDDQFSKIKDFIVDLLGGSAPTPATTPSVDIDSILNAPKVKAIIDRIKGILQQK